MYWINSNATTTELDAVATAQESKQSQYPQLSAAEISKVLTLSGMSDAGRFEAIIANTDTAGLLAMFGMSYAELKEILALPNERPAPAPEKNAQPILDKAITGPPEYISPYPPLPPAPLNIGLENALPIFSKADSKTVHSDHSKTMLPVEPIPAIDIGTPADSETPAPHVDITDTRTMTAPVSLAAQGEATNSEVPANDHSDVPAIAASNLPIPLPPTSAASLPPGPGPVVVIAEAVLPPAPGPGPVVVPAEPVPLPAPEPGPFVVPSEPIPPPVPGPGTVVVPAEPVPPPAPGPAVVVADSVPSTASPLSPTQTDTSVGGQIETGQGGSGQTGGTDGGSSFAGGTETGSKLDAAAVFKDSPSSTFSSSITSTTGLGLSGSSTSLLIGIEGGGVVLGVVAGDVAHSISSGSFGFSFGGGGGGSNHQGGHDSHNDAGGPGTTPLPPIIQISPTPTDGHVVDVINSPPDSPLPPTGLPGPGDITDFIIHGVVDAVNQHAGEGPADGSGSDGGDAHDNAPGPVVPPIDADANVNGAHAFIAHARTAITRMQAATVAAHALIDEAVETYHEARHAIDEAQGVLNEIATMVENEIEFIPTDYDRFEGANTEIELWTQILNLTNTLINDQQVLIHQQTAGINVMRALIAQSQALIPGWGEQPGIADANANLNNAAGEDAANGGHAGHLGGDVDIGGLPDEGNAGLNHAGDQPGDAPAPVDEPDADLPLNIVIANEVIAQGNALIDALREHVALREANIAQNETQIFDTQNDITWLQDRTVALAEQGLDFDGVPAEMQINWWHTEMTNTNARISEAQADLDRALNDITQLQAQITHARAEVDAWFHQNNAPGVHLVPDAPQGVAPVDGAIHANALAHQEDAHNVEGENQAAQPQQSVSLALVPAAKTNAPLPPGNTAVEPPLHFGTADMMNLDSVLLTFEFALPSSASDAADFIRHSHDIPAVQGVLAHWMGSIGPGFAAPVVAFEMFDYNLAGDGGIMLQVVLSDWRVIPNEAALIALQNTMQEYLDRLDSAVPDHPANLDGTMHQALSVVGVAEHSGLD